MARIRLSQRLLLLMFAAMFPLVAVLFYNLYALHNNRETEIREEAFQSGQLVALEMQRILSGMENILLAVAAAPSVQEFRADRCGLFLANIAPKVPGVSSLGVIGLDGVLKCRERSQGVGTSLADRAYFNDALRTDDFVVGDYTKGRMTGRAVLPLALPLKDSAGKTLGVVVMSLDLAWLQKILAERTFDAGAALTIADRNGVILARHPFPERFVGTRIPDRYQYLVKAKAPGTIELTSQDGTRRLLAYFPQNTPPKGLYMSTGVSIENSFYFIRQTTIFSVAATALAVVVSLLLAWQTNRYAIQKPVARILNALTAWRKGEAAVRTGMTSSGDELATIGAAIDDFMEELVTARAQRELLEAEMGHRIKNVLAIVQGVAVQTFRGKRSTTEALDVYSKRLQAIGQAFTTLGREHKAAELSTLVKSAIRPFEDPAHPRFSVSGPTFHVGAKAALAIAMALHELGTNAVKYGALGHAEGHVVISWTVEGEELAFHWEEQNGPVVVPPKKTGFGSRMMEKVLSGETGAVVNVDYSSTGLKYQFKAPVVRLTA